MTSAQNAALASVYRQLSVVVDDVLAQVPCDLYAAVTDADGGKSVCLSANAEGLAYLASILLRLAKDHEVGSHEHFDESSVLDRCDRALIIRYARADPEASSSCNGTTRDGRPGPT